MNAELRRKVDDLNRVNSDLQNLLNSTQIATLFLDAELRIRSFTPATRTLMRLTLGDIGRPITDFAQRFVGAVKPFTAAESGTRPEDARGRRFPIPCRWQ